MATERELRERTRRPVESEGRPAPDEVELEATPQPERHEPELEHPGLRDLSKRDYVAIVKRAVKESLDDQITDSAAAITYYAFLSIPSVLLVAVGVFSLVAGPNAVQTIVDKIGAVAPAQAVQLLEQSLQRTTQGGGGVTMIVIGSVLAVWTATGTINAVMRALNNAYDREESRNFFRLRAAALAMLVFILIAFLLVFGLLVLGPKLSGWMGDLIGLGSVFEWTWWIAQWPVLLGGLLLAFAVVLYVGPNVEHPRWKFLSFGAVVAVFVWLAASGAFAFYVANFGSYDKTWGSIAAVIIMLTWIWLSALALLFGAEINAEAERSRELRRGEPAERDLTAPPKA
jgi:membrane protein